jgi:hypothetical protein
VETVPVHAWSCETELAAVREQIIELTQAWRARKIQGPEADEQALTADRDRWIPEHAVDSNHPLSIRNDWPTLSLVAKRAHVDEGALPVMLVLPANGTTRWNSARPQPIWLG